MGSLLTGKALASAKTRGPQRCQDGDAVTDGSQIWLVPLRLSTNRAAARLRPYSSRSRAVTERQRWTSARLLGGLNLDSG